MIKNKSEWALRVFESNQVLEYPEYIKKAVEWCSDEE